MLRGFFRLIFRLVVLALLIFVGTGVFLVYDGLNDKGDLADCAVVLGDGVRADGEPGAILHERLDRAVELYRDGKVPLIIVSGADHLDGHDEATSMARYLEAHQVPARAVVEDHGGIHTAETAVGVAAIMHKRDLHSVIVVSHYYHITRTKLALRHEGIVEIGQAHVGTAVMDDAFMVAREDVAIYYYLFRYYLKPAADQATVQAEALTEQLKSKISSEEVKVKDVPNHQP